ncbi:DUF4827 family protein [uncultured Parabacteroides sp.]|jgi:hypothetical protein|uniref:DUF4827 family protein n=1 Tax=uncultured Parabacteroides sp. TaxID=512312 RepID=UPI0025F414E8|nr:DUF4827 family protein [uncultured Parabacteroides sp.]
MKRIKKYFDLLLLFCGLIFLVASCEAEKTTYQDVRDKEQAIIDKFIDENGLVVLKEYPKDSIFGEKEFVLLDNGVYLHVIDSGNGNRPVQDTKIQSVAKGLFLGREEGDVSFDGFQADDEWAKWPLKFKYSETQQAYRDENFLCEGYVSVMEYIGDNSSVSMIVPFTCGSVYQHSSYLPIYYEKVDFTFVKE